MATTLRAHPVETPADLIDQWLACFTNRNTVANYGRDLRNLFTATKATRPADLSPGNVIQWANGGGTVKNNTVRARLTAVMSFLRWCREENIPCPDTTRINRMARRYPKVYGKVDGKRPARWLTKEQAYGALLGACRDGTELGMRDELAIRLGLAGIRAFEAGSLTIANLVTTSTSWHIDWTGKGRRPRKATIGTETTTLLRTYLAAYAVALGRDLLPSDPLLCRRLNRGGRQGSLLAWGSGWADPAASMWDTTTRRARAAGLGHVAPHDLRRTAAGLLHTATTPDGAHFFDLLDIQKVLGHADPATTMRSYLDPMDNGVYDRASDVLD